MIKTAINTAHDLASKAEEYEERQDWRNAITVHDKAALQFKNAINDAIDPHTKNTLQLLANNHLRKSQELRRKLQRMQANHNPFDMRKLEREIQAIQTGELPTMNESYAMLSTEEEEDSEDPFNKFWGVVEPMMDRLSNPVAFTSAPIHDNDEPILDKPHQVMSGESVGEEEQSRIEREMSSISECFFAPNKPVTKEEELTHSDSSRDYEKENEELRAQIQQLTDKIQILEKKSVDSTVLKSSIIQFKNDVHKQALKILQTQESSMMTRSATATGLSLSKNIRTAGTSTAEIVNRIKELEDANRNLRSQNRKQDALMIKYRERWEKLKEGAKKRHTTSTTSTTSNPSNPTLLKSLASNPPTTTTSSSTSLSPHQN